MRVGTFTECGGESLTYQGRPTLSQNSPRPNGGGEPERVLADARISRVSPTRVSEGGPDGRWESSLGKQSTLRGRVRPLSLRTRI
jgi:hypothetical protein